MKTKLILLIVILHIIGSCKSSKNITEVNTPISEQHTHSQNTSSKTNLKLHEGMTDFSFDLFKTILSTKEKNENICLSPASLNMAIAMVYSGARNQTAEEMSKVLRFNRDMAVFHNEFDVYLKSLNVLRADSLVEFNLANKIFMEQTYKVLNQYRNDILTYFDGAFEQVDFINNAPATEKFINKWVEEMTKERIKNLIPENELDATTRMVIVNALYIKSEWLHRFRKEGNKEAHFHSNADDINNTVYMTQKKRGIKHTRFDSRSVIELPYTTNNLSLLVIKPDKGTSENIHTFIPTTKEYKTIINNLRPEYVYMEIPKFKIESSFSLTDALKEMGMISAFSNSDFSGISGKAELGISKILQKVFFEIDEQGTEAAAATAIFMELTSVNTREEERYINFIANSPFIFILKENTFNTPLFIGQYVSPN